MMKIMILPLIDRKELVDRAAMIAADLSRAGYIVETDVLHTFGRRSQRYCMTYRVVVDWQTLDDDTIYLLTDGESSWLSGGVRVPLDDLPNMIQARGI
jgi:glycyl-tRNA synthetase (class II)